MAHPPNGHRFIPPALPHTVAATEALDTPTRLKLARKILNNTCEATGAGYVLVMFVPGTDLVMRSFRGIDTPAECKAVVNEVAVLMSSHAATLAANEKHHPKDDQPAG